MIRLTQRLLVTALVGLSALSIHAQSNAVSQAPKTILYFTKSSGFEHSAIKDPATHPSKLGGDLNGISFPVIKAIAEKNNIKVVFSKDGSLFTPEYLSKFDAVVFYTTGDLTTVGTDKNPAMTAEGKKALFDYIKSGKGFVGLHSATDTFHSHSAKGAPHFQSDRDKADDYIKMIGGEFVSHGKQQPSKLIVTDSAFPGVAGVPATGITEEWYSLKNFAPDLHVILVQDTAGMQGFQYDRTPYPSTWIHAYGKGRVFYTNMGHRDDMWMSAMYQNIIAGALNWATGRVDADLTPNIAQVTPLADKGPADPVKK